MAKKSKHKPGSTYWRNKADVAWSEHIRWRDGRCIVCGTDRHLQAHHLIHRGHRFYRHNPENGVALCPRCHRLDMSNSAHMAPHVFEKWMRENRPEQFAWWDKNRWTIIKGVRVDYRAAYEHLAEVAKVVRA